MTTNTMGRDEAGKAIRKRAMEGCPLARELLILRGMCSCQGDEKSVDDAEDRYLELAVMRDAVPALHAEIERLRAEVKRLRADLMESDEIREKLGHLLTRTAAALKGEPPAGVWHSWHDLPEKATQLAEALRKLDERVQRDEALLRQALEALLGQRGEPDWHTGKQRENAIASLCERLGVKA